MDPLPIDPLLPAICETLVKSAALVLEAPPGAGKTTRVPRALLDAGLADRGEIVILEPRRIAARLAARRVADELGERLGETVGYTIRFEDTSGPRTRIRFVTEGVLTRKLIADPMLRGVSAVLLDEFHERHLQAEVALGLLRRLQSDARPDLRLVAMSATLDAAPIARYLGDCPILRAEGRAFDVEVEYLERSDDRPLESQVASAVRRLCAASLDGDVLVFLPGGAEIRRAARTLEPVAQAHDLLVVSLHGAMTSADQDRVIRRASKRKVILSTNVAETSVTIDGVVAVVDSGLARIATHAPWSGLPSLKTAKIARSSAVQRAGRAGRTRPGRCLRLYTRGDFLARPEHETPEVARLDLAESALELFAAGIHLEQFPWIEPPRASAIEAAVGLLGRLGAVERGADGALRISAVGRRMQRFPAHPRLSRMIVEAERRGVASDACAIAALISERDLRADGARARATEVASSDLLVQLDTFEQAEGYGPSFEGARRLGLEPTRVASVQRVRDALVRLVDRRAAKAPESADRVDAAIRAAILAGYPDRVGRLRRPANATGRGGIEVVLAGGGTAALAESSVVTDADLVVAVDAEELALGRRANTVVRLASAIEADWLLEQCTDDVSDTDEIVWNASAERVERVRKMAYEGLVLEESRGPALPGPDTTAVLAKAANARGYRAFTSDGGLERLRERIAFAREHCPEAGIAALDDVAIAEALARFVEGHRSFADLRDADFGDFLRVEIGHAALRTIDELAPDRIALHGGRTVRVDYGEGGPRVASRLQDFFGLASGPKLARGRVPAVLELLAPNQRAVQITTDLDGFWRLHYPAIARELRRRYPRHSWPDDPRHASPPPPRGHR